MKDPAHLLSVALYAMKETVQNFVEQRKMQYYEWLALDGQKCFSYGGEVRHSKLPEPPSIEVRCCTKNRWHTDSHAYEFVKFPYMYPKED